MRIRKCAAVEIATASASERFYVYFTHYPIDGSGRSGASRERITVTCR